MIEVLFELTVGCGPIIGGIALGLIVAYGLLYFLPYHLMLYIQETNMAPQIAMYHDQTIMIWIIAGILILLYSTPIFVHEAFNSFTKKIAGIVFCVLPLVALFTFIHSTSSENYVRNEFNEKYDNLANANIYFKNSIVGKDLRSAIDTNNYGMINNYYPKGSRDGVNKKVDGISANEMIDKLAIVSQIGIPEIMEKFKSIRSDKYITLEEYEDFKNYAFKVTKDTKLTGEQIRFLSRL